MPEATTEGSPDPKIGVWRGGEPKRWRRPAPNARATTTDWQAVPGPLQSGLSYHWCDSQPALPPASAWRAFNLNVKRLLDIAGALLLLLAFGPLLLAIAAAVKCSTPGPVLFRQLRVGRHQELFWIVKFRTMFDDLADHSGVRQTVLGDARVTPLGRFLRRWNLDELPQLFNVLGGSMALVGPRPHVPGQLAASLPYSVAVPYYNLRHAMKPGLTGWAQINGYRGPTDSLARARARVDHDIAYIQNFSVWLDLKILLLTLRRELTGGTGL
jgi:lipopolysaccharide/colanic/teichoic acid biosynthesis glycosyltransferase